MTGFNYNPADYSPQNGHAGVYGNASAVNQDLYNSKSVNWKDSTAYAYQQLAKYEDNALKIALMNYENEYNSPYEMMKRYQQAGINPFDVVGKQAQPAASADPASGGSAKSSQTQEQATKLRGAADMMSSIVQLVKGASTLQQDLQEISYRKEAFPLQLSLLANKSHYQPLFDEQNLNILSSKAMYQPLIDKYTAQSAETSMYAKMFDSLYNLWYMGFDPQDESVPFGAYLPGLDVSKAFSRSYRFKDSSSIRSLRRSLEQYRDWQKTFYRDKLRFEKSIKGRELEERKRHNRVLEELGGIGLGTSFFGNALRLLLR